MKRSLMAGMLLAGFAVLYAPTSQATPGTEIPSATLSGIFSGGVQAFFRSADSYGFPVVGTACVKTAEDKTTGKKTCIDQKSGLLYSSTKRQGFGLGGLNFGGDLPRLVLHGTLLSLKNDDILFWQANLGFNPYSDSFGEGKVLTSWQLSYLNSNIGVLRIGSNNGLDGYDYFDPLLSQKLATNETYWFPGVGSAAPFAYKAPGLLWVSPAWNGASIAFSIGASVKQHSGPDGKWHDDLSGSMGANNVLSYLNIPTQDTPQRAIQWALSLQGFWHGKWILGYGQSRQLNEDGLDYFRIKRAAHIEFANLFLKHYINVIRVSWSQNTGINSSGVYTAFALNDLNLQSDFDAMLVTPFKANPKFSPFPRTQFTKPVPYWNAGVTFTLWRPVLDHSDLSTSVGYTVTRTYGYDFPGFALNSYPNIGRQYFFKNTKYDTRYNQVFSYGENIDKQLESFGIPSYSPETAYQRGQLRSQSVYLNMTFRYSSPYDFFNNSLTFNVVGELAYTKVAMKLEGTPEQRDLGYPTNTFDLGNALWARLQVGFQYNF